MAQDLIKLIEKVQNQSESGYVKVQNKKDKKKPVFIYDGGDLTKSYVDFVEDVFTGKYGEVTENTIKAFGQSLKTSIDKFKPSYLQKKSSIKEVVPGIFIHTSMDSSTMKLKLMMIAESFGYFPYFSENQ